MRGLVPFFTSKKTWKTPVEEFYFKSNTPPWMFFMFFLSWYQIVPNISFCLYNGEFQRKTRIFEMIKRCPHSLSTFSIVTHFVPVTSSYTSWKHHETREFCDIFMGYTKSKVFWMFARGIKRDQFHEMS